MGLRHLDSLFRPKSVAVIGASNRPKSIGTVVMQNILLHGGFGGPILPVHPKHTAITGVLAYQSVADLPLVPDLAIICTPPQQVPQYVLELGKKGVGTVLVMSTDLEKFTHQDGTTYRDAMLETARDYSMRLLGPNCLGIIIPRSGLNASFGHTNVQKGQIAFVSQSDSLGIAVLDWARAKGIGFSNFISLGDCADIDFADVVDYLGEDPYTSSVLLYIEQIRNARKFISAARSASRNKPIVAIKSGIMDEDEKPTVLPGGFRISSDSIFDGLLRRAGMLRVSDVAELFDTVETMARSKPPRGDRLAILSNGGGPAMMAKDILASLGGRMAQLSEDTLRELDERLQGDYFGSNPIRVIDHAPSDIYSQALEVLLRDKGIDAVMVIHVPTAFASSEDIAGAVVNSLGRRPKNIYTVWLGEEDTRQARRIFALAGVPTYETPDHAVRLFMNMVRFRRNQELLMETPDSVTQEFTPDTEAARTLVKNALEEGRSTLSQSETKEILSVYAIPVVDTRIVEDAEEAELMARELGYPVALKILSPDITSKQDLGGVALDLESPEDIRKAAQAMVSRIRKIRPEAEIEGFILQKMDRRPGAHELLLGVSTHPEIGPVVVFGQGGLAARVIKDYASGLPPLNMTLAKELIQRTRISKLLEGYQGMESADTDSIRLTLVQLSQLVIDVPEITGLSINPLLADHSGVLVLDAQIEVAPTQQSGPARLAIRPYPQHLEEWTTLKDGTEILMRPIRPEDEHSHLDFFNKLSEEDRRMRFFGFVHEMPHSQLAKFTQIDYDREMAFVAVRTGEDGEIETLGVNRAYFDPDNVEAEFAVVSRTDIKGVGLGTLLMDKMVRYCVNRGTKELVAYTLKENDAMKALGRKFGASVRVLPDDPDTIELRIPLEGNEKIERG